MYQFCSAFGVSPEVYYNTSVEDVEVLLMINSEVEKARLPKK